MRKQQQDIQHVVHDLVGDDNLDEMRYTALILLPIPDRFESYHYEQQGSVRQRSCPINGRQREEIRFASHLPIQSYEGLRTWSHRGTNGDIPCKSYDDDFERVTKTVRRRMRLTHRPAR